MLVLDLRMSKLRGHGDLTHSGEVGNEAGMTSLFGFLFLGPQSSPSDQFRDISKVIEL